MTLVSVKVPGGTVPEAHTTKNLDPLTVGHDYIRFSSFIRTLNNI